MQCLSFDKGTKKPNVIIFQSLNFLSHDISLLWIMKCLMIKLRLISGKNLINENFVHYIEFV